MIVSRIVIEGQRRLCGELELQGSKNGVLPILAACVINRGVSVIENCPELSDVENTLLILQSLGCTVSREGHRVTVDASTINGSAVCGEMTGCMRSSIGFLGALLARMGSAEVGYPGGCALGARPIDIHIDLLRRLGARVECGGSVKAVCTDPKGSRIRLKGLSVGATENAMLFACGCRGITRIENAAAEPEIVELAEFLNAMGHRVKGAGGRCIEITPASTCRGTVVHRVHPDRIAAATYICAVMSAGGDVLLCGARGCSMANVVRTAANMGCEFRYDRRGLRVSANGRPTSPGRIITRPHPGFPTDAQPMFTAVCSVASGQTLIEDTVFSDRFRQCGELIKMGADITVESGRVRVKGVRELQGAEVKAYDLRGGAAMAVAAVGARGRTVISGTEYIDRGYQRIEQSLAALGADVERTDG